MKKINWMAVSKVHITPITPDPNSRERYGSSGDRTHREDEAELESQEEKSDRLEISKGARETYAMHATGPDMDFARKALDRTPDLQENRAGQIMQHIESGYYRLPAVIRKIVARMIPGLR